MCSNFEPEDMWIQNMFNNWQMIRFLQPNYLLQPDDSSSQTDSSIYFVDHIDFQFANMF